MPEKTQRRKHTQRERKNHEINFHFWKSITRQFRQTDWTWFRYVIACMLLLFFFLPNDINLTSWEKGRESRKWNENNRKICLCFSIGPFVFSGIFCCCCVSVSTWKFTFIDIFNSVDSIRVSSKTQCGLLYFGLMSQHAFVSWTWRFVIYEILTKSKGRTVWRGRNAKVQTHAIQTRARPRSITVRRRNK